MGLRNSAPGIGRRFRSSSRAVANGASAETALALPETAASVLLLDRASALFDVGWGDLAAHA